MDRPVYLSILLIFRSVQSSPQSLHILILKTIGLVLQKNLTIKVQRELGHLLHHLPAYTRILMMLRRTLEGNAMDFFSLAYPCHVVIICHYFFEHVWLGVCNSKHKFATENVSLFGFF